METTQRKLSVQVQFLAFLGPLIALMTLMVIFVKASPHSFYLSLATISGVLISWKWKERGFAFSCLFILCLYVYQYSGMHPNERLWNLGISFAIALGFGITALTYQEVDDLITTEDEDHSLNALKEALVQAQEEASAKQSQIDSYHQLVDTARQEVAKVSVQHQKLLKDFLEKQLEWSRLQEKLSHSVPQEDFDQLQLQLHVAQERIHILSEQQALSTDLEGTVGKKEEEIVLLKGQLQEMEHELARISEEIESQLHIEKLENKQQVHELQLQIQSVEMHLMQKDQELTQKHTQMQHLEKDLSNYLQKEQQANADLSQKQEMINQLQLHCQEAKQTIEDLENLLTKKEVEVVDLQKELHVTTTLVQKQEQVELCYVEAKKEIDDLQKLLAKKDNEVLSFKKALETPPLIQVGEIAPGEMRRLEGLLKQLRIQFEEKSQTLDMARKELFRTQEKLLSLEKECEERSTYDMDVTEQYYQRYIHQLQSEVDHLHEEVEHLEGLVAKLISF